MTTNTLARPTLRVCSERGLLLNDISLFTGSPDELRSHLKNLMSRRRPTLVSVLNVDQVLTLGELHDYRRAFSSSGLVTIDGAPVAALGRLIGHRQSRRYPGPMLVDEACILAAEHGWRVAILGGRNEVATQAAFQLRCRYPNLDVRTVPFPFISSLDDPRIYAVLSNLESSHPQIVLTCLGAPKQELWFHEWRDHLPPAVYLGVGAAVDFLAGTVKRAPVFVQRYGLEWLWRLCQEPRRLAHRYLIRGPRFLLVVQRSLLASIVR